MRWPLGLIQASYRGGAPRGWLRRPWGGRGYTITELPLWRWQESPVDAAIAAYVGRGRRSDLWPEDLDHLLHFARRSCLRALRDRNRQHVTDAFDALALVDPDGVDDARDAAVLGYLAVCVAQELGVPAPEATAAMARANAEIAEMIDYEDDETGGVYLDNLPNLSGYRIVWTPPGPVLVADMTPGRLTRRPGITRLRLLRRSLNPSTRNCSPVFGLNGRESHMADADASALGT
jgi:hypothetical protein